MKLTGGNYPAPLKIIDVVKAGSLLLFSISKSLSLSLSSASIHHHVSHHTPGLESGPAAVRTHLHVT